MLPNLPAAESDVSHLPRNNPARVWSWLFFGLCLTTFSALAQPQQFILFNVNRASEADAFNHISREFKASAEDRVQVGVAAIFSYLHHSRPDVVEHLKDFLARSETTGVPVVVQLDGENWWGARPELWNWWDESRQGFSPSNRYNVEWTSWWPDDAIKIAWRNWGRQLRVLPPPNLMSPDYRKACHDEMRVLVPVILEWWQRLPAEKKYLLVGIKLGWESSIGVNAWYYPEGNALLDKPPAEDPTHGLKAGEVPARGVAQIGYAAVKTAGIRSAGDITEADLAEVTRRHLDDLCRLAAEIGVPRDRLFTHVAGWKEDELLYQAALNEFSCPGWSFYGHAADPAGDVGVQRALRRTEAPWWAAVEWLFQGPQQTEPWRDALTATLRQPRCRYLCIYNWHGVRHSEEILKAVSLTLQTHNTPPAPGHSVLAPDQRAVVVKIPGPAADQRKSAVKNSDRPNILWLVSEDNTTLLGCYGDPIARTPTLDSLARKGVLFERCFAQPVCAPSRFTLITGTFAVSSGPANHMRASGEIPPWMKGFPAFLREAGYHTSNNAKTDYNAPIDMKETWSASGRNAHYQKRALPDQPFFSVFNHEVTHESCLFPEQDVAFDFAPTDPATVRLPPYQPDTREIRADWARYYDHMALLDRQIGAKLKDLERDGLAENTIVFYYADNGGVLPRSKRFLHQSGTHVPLIVYFPPKWRHLSPAAPGTRIRHPVSFIDFAPAVLSLAGIEIPGYMPGRPFVGGNVATNEFVFCTRDRMDERYDMMRSVADSRWLYIRNFRPDLPYIQPLEYPFKARGYQSWARMAREGKLTPQTARFWGEKVSEELYDMEADPHNVNNLAANPVHRQTLDRMRDALRRHTLEVRDNGFLPEGSPLEGFENSRKPGVYPLNGVFELATLASDRNPANLPRLITALEDPSEPVRWWAAQGCAILRENATPAEPALRKRLDDPSGAVQVAAAEALAGLGHVDLALPVLVRCLQDTNNAAFGLQAANVLDRLGERARPALAAMSARLLAISSGGEPDRMEQYQQRILSRMISVLEGKAEALVYSQRQRENPNGAK
jgi:arylsulfatase A-like enzyme